MVPALKDTLIVSCIGYKEKRIPLTAKTKFPLRVALSPDVSLLSEVVIKPKKEKYKKKNNPAVELARKLIEHREDGSPKNKDFYSRDRHERLNIALNNFNSSEESHFGKKFSFLDQYIDTSLISGKPILHISSRELLATDYHRKEPHSERQYVKARQRAGIDDVVSDESIEAIFEETFKDVDIFQDNITIFRNKFVSPISTIGLSFYKYYLMDTVDVEGETLFLTHGHLENLPIEAGYVVLQGHTHVPVCEHKPGGWWLLNPGSVSIPKEDSPHSYLLLKDGTFYWKTLGGETYRTAPMFG